MFMEVNIRELKCLTISANWEPTVYDLQIDSYNNVLLFITIVCARC